jgi:hypothetical protein
LGSKSVEQAEKRERQTNQRIMATAPLHGTSCRSQGSPRSTRLRIATRITQNAIEFSSVCMQCNALDERVTRSPSRIRVNTAHAGIAERNR